MNRFSASSLDLSRIDRSDVFDSVSFEGIRLERMEQLKQQLTAAGLEYDVEKLQTSSGAFLQRSSGYREYLTRLAFQDAQASVLLAFSWGEHLDRLGEGIGTARHPGEEDERYKLRIQLAPEALSTAGTPGGYIYHATSVSGDVRDVSLKVLNKGTPNVTVEIAILSAVGDGVPDADLLGAIRLKLWDEKIGLLTDAISVRPAVILPYEYSAKLIVRPGPDADLVKTKAEKKLWEAADTYKRLGGKVPMNALTAAAYVPDVREVVPEPSLGDIVPKHFQAAVLKEAKLKVHIADD